MSLHQASRWLRNLMSTSGMRVSMSSPLGQTHIEAGGGRVNHDPYRGTYAAFVLNRSTQVIVA